MASSAVRTGTSGGRLWNEEMSIVDKIFSSSSTREDPAATATRRTAQASNTHRTQKNPWSSQKDYFQRFYRDILERQEVEKFDHYFTPDCRISINGKVLNAESFKSRMAYLRENCRKIVVRVLNSSVSECGLKISDVHESRAWKKGLQEDEKLIVAIVVQMSDLCPDTFRIRNFFDATYHPDAAEEVGKSGSGNVDGRDDSGEIATLDEVVTATNDE